MFDLQTAKLFFAMLTVAVNVVVVGYVVISVAALWSGRASELKDQFHEYVAGHEMLFGSVVAGSAMLGSLYQSDADHGRQTVGDDKHATLFPVV